MSFRKAEKAPPKTQKLITDNRKDLKGPKPVKTRKPIPKIGAYGKRTAAPKRKWRDAVRERDNCQCQMPKIDPGHVCFGALECHHLYPQGTHRSLCLEVDNGALLCEGGHREAHRDLKAFRDLWESVNPGYRGRLEK